MRGPVAGLAALLAVLLLPLALLSGWMKIVATDDDAYVRTVAPLSQDPEVRRAVADRLHAQTVGEIERVTGRPLPELGRSLVRTAVEGVIASPAFEQAWKDGNRSAHEQAIAVLDGRQEATALLDGRVAIVLGTLLDEVLQGLVRSGLLPGERVPRISVAFPLLTQGDLRKAQDGYAALQRAGFWVPLAWSVLTFVALLLSPRRGRTLGRIGLGSVVTLAVLLGVVFLVRHQVIAHAPTETDGDLLRAVWDVVVRSLLVSIGVAAAASAVLGLGGLAAGRRAA